MWKVVVSTYQDEKRREVLLFLTLAFVVMSYRMYEWTQTTVRNGISSVPSQNPRPRFFSSVFVPCKLFRNIFPMFCSLRLISFFCLFSSSLIKCCGDRFQLLDQTCYLFCLAAGLLVAHTIGNEMKHLFARSMVNLRWSVVMYYRILYVDFTLNKLKYKW